MKTVCVIPARYASTRLPGKPLVLIGNKPMIRHVYERACLAGSIDQVIIATDDERIERVAGQFGAAVVMTDPTLPSGTDRVYAAIKEVDADVIINLQGDEPFIEPRLLDQLAAMFGNPEVQIATPVGPVSSYEELTDPNLVRVTRDIHGRALYFTRATIPFLRDEPDKKKWPATVPFYKHIGIYAYRKEILAQLTGLPPAMLEQAEKLEQLRFLENGYTIHTLVSDYKALSVDTEEDVKTAQKIITEIQEN